MSHSLNDYRIAPIGEGPLAATWQDKPHRLIYDLCNEVEAVQDRLDRLQRAVLMYLTIRDQRERDEDEYCAAGMTYCHEQLENAEAMLRQEVAKSGVPTH